MRVWSCADTTCVAADVADAVVFIVASIVRGRGGGGRTRL